MLAILNSLNDHNLSIFQPILMILVSKFMVYRALSNKAYLSLGSLSPLKQKTLKCIEMTLKLDQFQKYPQNLHTPQNIHFSENHKKYWNSECWTKQSSPSLRMCENIRVPPPRPGGVLWSWRSYFSKLFKEFHRLQNSRCQDNQKELFLNIIVENQWSDSNNLVQMFFDWPCTKIVHIANPVWKNGYVREATHIFFLISGIGIISLNPDLFFLEDFSF